MTILQIEYSYKIHVFMKSFVYHSICTVFTILFVESLSSYIYGHHLYWNIDIYIYIYISYMWSLPCYIKGFNLSMSIKSQQWSQWWFFWQKWRKVFTKKCLKTNLYRKNFLPKISLKKYLSNILKSFPPTDSKEKLAQKKDLWREISTK